jgi:hypothetical protein
MPRITDQNARSAPILRDGSSLAPFSIAFVGRGHEWNVERGVVVSPVEVHALVNRVRHEFLEMPGLRLTPQQAARLWGLDRPACDNVIDVLVRAEFLRWTPAGTVARVEGPHPSPGTPAGSNTTVTPRGYLPQ